MIFSINSRDYMGDYYRGFFGGILGVSSIGHMGMQRVEGLGRRVRHLGVEA